MTIYSRDRVHGTSKGMLRLHGCCTSWFSFEVWFHHGTITYVVREHNIDRLPKSYRLQSDQTPTEGKSRRHTAGWTRGSWVVYMQQSLLWNLYWRRRIATRSIINNYGNIITAAHVHAMPVTWPYPIPAIADQPSETLRFRLWRTWCRSSSSCLQRRTFSLEQPCLG